MSAVQGLVRIEGAPRDYAWGSATRIPELLGVEPAGGPVAELWFGAHPEAQARTRPCRPAGSTPVTTPDGEPPLTAGGPGATTDPPDGERRTTGGEPRSLGDHIAADPSRTLGADVVTRYGEHLPYLLKLIAPDRALSLQVHPDLERARRRFDEEEAAGIPRGDFARSYRDPNHKPEMVYALTRFEAVCGFRAPRRAIEVLAGLGTPLTAELEEALRAAPSADGVRSVVERLLREETRPSADEVAAVAAACARRLADGSSPSPRMDRIVGQLAGEHPGDPGVVVALLLNPVTLHPGEAMFVPAGAVHAYLSGFAVEIMASSDNVLRAGLTSKHVAVGEVLEALEYVAAPPVRIAPETVSESVGVYYAPVDDFELAVVTLEAEGEAESLVPGRGPRILLALDGEVTVTVDGLAATLHRGQAVFVAGDLGPVTVTGRGRLVQADVP
ncbi:mannose-6-phosphate isomerase, class I [Georgenia sp. Z1344]|uniref:mannose-6-phosphate isomerase, class I n=1 Tax=Georgenia sp. Z1344 TaxID=3416706 RepID=UPI003CED9BB4